jgi:hypothetical protein
LPSTEVAAYDDLSQAIPSIAVTTTVPAGSVASLPESPPLEPQLANERAMNGTAAKVRKRMNRIYKSELWKNNWSEVTLMGGFQTARRQVRSDVDDSN